MALDLTAIDDRVLSDPVRRVASQSAPAALREMAARGSAPLSPVDLLTALYQLASPWLTDDELPLTARLARSTVDGLPDNLLAGALASDVDPRVLDFFGRRVILRPALLQPLLLNRATADETFARLAQMCGERELQMIAANEERLLRHPAIIAALYMNPKTPMSVAGRAVELAVRNGVTVEGIPGFEDVKAALGEVTTDAAPFDGSDDEVFKSGTVPDEEMPAQVAEEQKEEEEEEDVPIHLMTKIAKIRLATVGNAFARSVLIRDTSRVVFMAAIRSPGVNDNEVARYATNRGLSEEVIRYIASQRHFVRLYSVKLGLINNPKCPLQAAMGLLPHLTARDLRGVARSKQIPSQLALAAGNLLRKRDAT
jgi:hypothetical protein